VFSNLDGLFAFHTSAEDAEYSHPSSAEPRRTGRPGAGSLSMLCPYQDARTGERLPAFSVQLERLQVGHEQATGLARASARNTAATRSTWSSICSRRWIESRGRSEVVSPAKRSQEHRLLAVHPRPTAVAVVTESPTGDGSRLGASPSRSIRTTSGGVAEQAPLEHARTRLSALHWRRCGYSPVSRTAV